MERNSKYKAFISYSHTDEKSAAWLHRWLEQYRIPKQLVERNTLSTNRLKPIFRDREELSSSSSLSESIQTALADSESLIVICSPLSAQSRWVNEEIETYKRLGRADRIYCLIVEGEPSISFPPAIRSSNEPLAADLQHDGKLNAALKIAAGILEVRFDELRQRDSQARHRRLIGISGASVAGMLLAIGLASFAMISRQQAVDARVEAERQWARAEVEAETSRQTTDFLVDLFKVSDPSESRGDEYTAHDILDKGAERIATRLADQPAIQATLLDTLGTVYTGLGSVQRATRMLRNAVMKRRELRGREHVEVAESLNHLGQVLKLKAEYAEAETTIREALNIRRELLGNMHPDVAQSINDLGDVLARNGDHEAAEALFREALAIRRQLFGDKDPSIAQTLEDLALNLYDQGDYERPVSLLREAVAIRFEMQGGPHPDLAEAINNLGFVLGELGEYEEAESLYRESLEMKRKLLPEVHAEIAMGLNNVAFVLHDQGDLEQAETMYREALAMQRAVFGEDHTDVAMSLTNLAYLLYDKGEQKAAVEMSRESLATYRRVLGDSHPSVALGMNNLATWLTESGDYQAAEQLLRQSLALQEDLLGYEHPDVAASMTLLGNLLVATLRYEEAYDLAARARVIFATALSEEHWRTAVAASTEGTSLAGLGRYQEAEILLLKAHVVLSNDEGAIPVFVTETTRRLACLYEAWDKTNEAARYLALLGDVKPGSNCVAEIP